MPDRLSAAQRRKVRGNMRWSTDKCLYCRTNVRWWHLIKDVPTCPNCGSTETMNGTTCTPA